MNRCGSTLVSPPTPSLWIAKPAQFIPRVSQWQQHDTAVVRQQMLEQFVKKGRADAKAWAEECGLLDLLPPSAENRYEADGGGTQKSKMESTAGTAASSA